MNPARNSICLSVFFALVVVAPVGADGVAVSRVAFPVAAVSSVPAPASSVPNIAAAPNPPETDYGAWIVPGPDEPAILAGVGDGFGKKAVHYSSMALVAGGTVLCAAGVATAVGGISISGGIDGTVIHRGAIYFISGSLVSAIFSAVMNATAPSITSPE